jgi:Spy/CpxP family protein refolding chaperone
MGGGHEMSVAAQDVAGGPAGHAHFMLTHLYKAVNATDAQKAQIEPIVKQAMVDLAPYHDQFSTAHTQLLALFGQSTIDRAALEQLRVQERQQVDLSSKRLMQLVADIGDVLTPEQRQQLQAHIQAMHQHAKHG